MLVQLSVKNVATLAHVELDIPPGLVVLTGETGAGKSLLIESLRFALGNRAKGNLVRHGAEYAEVVAVFHLPSIHPVRSILKEDELEDPDEPDRLVLRRVVKSGGRSVLQVNGVTVPLRALDRLRPILIDLTSQHDHVRLMDREHHRETLDTHPDVRPSYAEYRLTYLAWQELHERAMNLKRKARARAERLDYLNFLLEECEGLAPKENEEDELEQLWRRLSHAEELQRISGDINLVLDSGDRSVQSSLSEAATRLSELARLDEKTGEKLFERLESIQAEVQDLAQTIRDYGLDIDTDSSTRSEIEERIEALKKLRKRFGCSSSELLKCIDKAKEEQEDLDGVGDQAGEAEEKAEKAFEKVQKKGLKLRTTRKNTVEPITKAIEESLAQLKMPDARLDIRSESLEKAGAHGLDEIAIHAQTNPGEGFHPLEEIASGGELSRLLLALKTAVRGSDPVLSTVFDEVDTGIGGEVAMTVGRLLHGLAKDNQVLCISHLPQIAAAADVHLHVRKRIEEGRTYTEVEEIKGQDRVRVLSELLGGSDSKGAKAHAEDLLRLAQG